MPNEEENSELSVKLKTGGVQRLEMEDDIFVYLRE